MQDSSEPIPGQMDIWECIAQAQADGDAHPPTKGEPMSAVTDERVIADRLDVQMLERPHLWPDTLHGHPCVYVKRTTHNQTGPVIRDGDGFLVFAHDWDADPEPTVEPVSYPTAEAIVADGWKVD